jgi:hypothetical protein
MEAIMTGTKSIVLDKHALLRICNALNVEAAAFEAQANYGKHLPKDTRDVLRYSARDNRELTKNLLAQWGGHTEVED